MKKAESIIDESGASRLEVLSGVSLFSVLSRPELEEISRVMASLRYRKGEVVCREGEPGDLFHVIVSGELEVRVGSDERVINRMGPGEFFGEVSLLMGGPRTATVVAARSTELLALQKADFDEACMRNPKVLEYISRIVCRRLAAMGRGGPVAKKLTTILVGGDKEIKGKTLVASALGAFIADVAKREALVVHFRPNGAAESLADLSRGPADRITAAVKRFGGGAAHLEATAPQADSERQLTHEFSQFLETASEAFHYVVLDLGTASRALESSIHEVSDFHVELVRQCHPGSPEIEAGKARVFRVVNLHHPDSLPIPINHCEPFLIPADPALRNLDLESQVAYLREHPRSPAAPPLRRLARKMLGLSVGIAVGGGAAFGISHVGVLEVLEDHDVPIDLVAGTSMGSIVGLGYASGMTPAEMVEIAREKGNPATILSALDFTLTQPGLLAGNRIVEIFAPLSKARDFTDLLLPCRTVATDIESGESVSIGSGPISTAFRASSSIPLIWTPIRHQGRTLVDGAMVNPVPADVVHEMGADLCIAVNVVPSLKKGVDTVLSRAYRKLNRFNPLSYLGGSRDLPSTFDTVMNSIQQLQHELGNFRAISADVRIQPDLSEFTWTEFYRPMEFIERGRQAAERAIPEINRVIAEKMASA